MKLIRKAGATSQILQIFIRDSSSTTGGGLTGLTNASSSLTAYYHRDTDTTATAISLVTMTVGTFTSSGFKEIDATNMPGWYQFCPPNAALASGAASCGFHLKGATNMAPTPIEVDLSAQVDVTSINAVATTSVTTINANVGTTQPQNFTGTGASALVKSDMVDIAGAAVSTSTAQIGVNAVNIGGTSQTGRDLGASVLLSSGTGTGQILLSSGTVTVGTNNDKTGYTASTVTDKTGYALTAAYDAAKTAAQAGDIMKVSSGTGANQISLSSGTVTVGTNNDKTGYSLTAAYDAAKTAAQAGDSMALTTAATAAAADKLLGRNLAGGSDGGRTVKDALRFLRNLVQIVGTTMTVMLEDDTTTAWTAAVTTDAAANPVTKVDPT